MNDTDAIRSSEPAVESVTAGEMLRQARTAAGMHIASLASSIKVPVRKLELLEADRYDDLPDPAFTRALAQTVCRALKIDAAPVLKLLPKAASQTVLEQMAGGINKPFREGVAASQTSSRMGSVLRPVTLATVVLVVAAAALFLTPKVSEWWSSGRLPWVAASEPDNGASPAAPASAPEPASELAREPAAALPPATVVEVLPPMTPAPPAPGPERPAPASQPAADSASAVAPPEPRPIPVQPEPRPVPAAPQPPLEARNPDASLAAAPPPVSAPAPEASTRPAPTNPAADAPAAGTDDAAVDDPQPAPAEVERYAVVLMASETSWVQVRDASGKVLLSRNLEPGQPAGVDGQYPISVVVGNAVSTQLWSKGRVIDLKATARENVARVELR